jgi:hypothetical protein
MQCGRTGNGITTAPGRLEGCTRFFIIDIWEVIMDISRRLGILVFCAVPAIVGGGIVYAIFDSLTAMWIYQVLLAVTAGALVSR